VCANMPRLGRGWQVTLCASLLACCRAGWTGLLGLSFESTSPVEAKSLHCPSGFITGIRIKYGRTRSEDRDLYDFKLKCQNRWTSWSGLFFKSEVEDKTWECPSKMYMTGVEVKRGRREWGDKDTYDFKLQCSGVWQSFIGMKFGGEQEHAKTECPAGEGASGLKVFRGFVDWGDKDLYEYELNCKSIAQNLASIRGLPDLKMLGLPRNTLLWDGEQLSTWLEALGLGSLAPNFLYHNVNGGTVFLLTEDHLRDLGFTLVGDRLYFIELLTQLYDDIVAWSASLGVQLATHPVPPLRQLGLSLQPTSWSVKDVCKVLNAVGLGEYMELFVEHRVQGDVLFNLTEENLKEMGIEKVGDRLLITDIVQTLYEQVTGWQEQQVSQKQMPQVLSLPSA